MELLRRKELEVVVRALTEGVLIIEPDQSISFANPANHVPKLIKVGQQLKSEGAEFIVAYGYCWGGKVVASAGSQPDSPFSAVRIVSAPPPDRFDRKRALLALFTGFARATSSRGASTMAEVPSETNC